MFHQTLSTCISVQILSSRITTILYNHTLHLNRLSTAHTARVGYSPGITANGLQGIEEIVGVPLVLHSEQRAVVASEEGILPVELAEVALVLVAAAVGGNGLQLGDVVVGDLPLIGDHVGPGGSLVPGGADLHGHSGVAEGGEDGVVDVAGVGDVHADTDGDHAGLSQVPQSGAHALVVVLQGVAGNQTATVLVSSNGQVTPRQGTHVLVVVVVIRSVLGQAQFVGDAKVGESVGEGGQDSLHISGGLVVGSDGVDDEDAAGHLVDDSHTLVDHGGQQLMELSDGLVEGVSGDVGSSELKSSTGDGGILVSLDGHRHDNTIVTGTTTAESPVQIGVLGA